jgi:hypothetical protein
MISKKGYSFKSSANNETFIKKRTKVVRLVIGCGDEGEEERMKGVGALWYILRDKDVGREWGNHRIKSHVGLYLQRAL